MCVSPALINVSPGRTLQMLQHLEDTAGVSVALTIVMATLALRMDDLPQYTQLMDRHTEVGVWVQRDGRSSWFLEKEADTEVPLKKTKKQTAFYSLASRDRQR